MKIPNIHPGEVLLEEFLKPLNIPISTISKDINENIQKVVNGKKNINNNLATKLSNYFGNSKEFWLNLQQQYNKEKQMSNNLMTTIIVLGLFAMITIIAVTGLITNKNTTTTTVITK